MSDPADNAPDNLHRPVARRWWLNLALLIVIVALGVFAWYYSGRSPDHDKTSLTDLDPQTIRRIEITPKNPPSAVLQRTDDGWRLMEPIKARADSFAIEPLLRLARAPIEATITPGEGGLARYGLDRPALTVRLDNKEIRFGDMHPLKDAHYVQVDSTVALISSRYYAQASMKYDNWLDSRLIEPGRKPISFKLPGFTLTRKDGTWQRQPEIASLSSDAINAFVDNWLYARALQVTKLSARKAIERAVISFEGNDNATLTIDVLARAPELVLARPDEGLEYHFPAEMSQRLFTLTGDAPK